MKLTTPKFILVSMATLSTLGLLVWWSWEHPAAPGWKRGSVRIRRPEFHSILSTPEIEFSSDGRFLCVHSDYFDETRKTKRFVFDRAGVEVNDALDAEGVLLEPYRVLFSRLALRSSTGLTPTWRLYYEALTGHEDFLRGSGGWVFSLDYTWALRLVPPRWNIECWQLNPSRKLAWETTIKKESRPNPELLEMFSTNDDRRALIAFSDIAYVLSFEDGRIVDEFGYDKRRVSAEELHRLAGEGPFSDHLRPSEFAFQPELGLLAYGDSYSRELRVVSVEDPTRTVFEAYTSDSLMGPGGGIWVMRDVRFCGADYLVVDTDSSARGSPFTPTISQTDIFYVPTWQRVWTERSPSIRRTCVAPDGGRVALFRDRVLEIGDFDSLDNVVAH